MFLLSTGIIIQSHAESLPYHIYSDNVHHIETNASVCFLGFFFVFCFLSFVFLVLYPQHMEFSRLGVESKL